MKKVITIDKDYWQQLCPQAKVTHIVLLEAIKSICNSKDLTNKQDGWAIISLNTLIYEVPCLGITSKASMASLVSDLLEWGFIVTKKQGQNQLFQYTEKAELMDRDKFADNKPISILSKKDYSGADVEDDRLRISILEFINLRKKLKKPMTENAIKRMMKRLNELSGGDIDKQIQILNQSIDHCWLDMYPLKDNGNNKKYSNYLPIPDRWGSHVRN